MPLSKKKLAVIHIAKAQVGMSDDEYRDLLASFQTDRGEAVTSSKSLTDPQFDEIMDHFKTLGFTNRFNKKHRSVSGMYMKKANAIRLDMGLSWAYVDGIGKNISQKTLGKTIEKFEWLPHDIQQKVVQALIYHQKRHGKKKEVKNG